jgi:hypothetical protein
VRCRFSRDRGRPGCNQATDISLPCIGTGLARTQRARRSWRAVDARRRSNHEAFHSPIKPCSPAPSGSSRGLFASGVSARRPRGCPRWEGGITHAGLHPQPGDRWMATWRSPRISGARTPVGQAGNIAEPLMRYRVDPGASFAWAPRSSHHPGFAPGGSFGATRHARAGIHFHHALRPSHECVDSMDYIGGRRVIHACAGLRHARPRA